MLGRLSDVLAEKGGQLYWIAPDANVAAAVREMNERGIGALLVLAEERLVGIFTERDVLRRVVAAGKDVNQTRISEVMTREVVTVRHDVSVEDAMAILTQKRCRHLPVLDQDRVEGIVSIGDLTQWVNRDREVQILQLVNYITGRYPA